MLVWLNNLPLERSVRLGLEAFVLLEVRFVELSTRPVRNAGSGLLVIRLSNFVTVTWGFLFMVVLDDLPDVVVVVAVTLLVVFEVRTVEPLADNDAPRERIFWISFIFVLLCIVVVLDFEFDMAVTVFYTNVVRLEKNSNVTHK